MPLKFEYLFRGRMSHIEGVDDAEEFNVTCAAFKDAGFSTFDVNNVLRVLAVILHLGNVKFLSGKQLTVNSCFIRY